MYNNEEKFNESVQGIPFRDKPSERKVKEIRKKNYKRKEINMMNARR